MSVSRQGVLVVEYVASGHWIVHAGELARHHVQSGDVANEHDLVRFAHCLADQYGGVAVRCIVLLVPRASIDEKCGEPRAIATYPRRVYRLTKGLAAAYAVGDILAPCLLVHHDYGSEMSVVLKTDGGFGEHAVTAGEGNAVGALVDWLHLKAVVIIGDQSGSSDEYHDGMSPSSSPAMIRLSRDAFVAGAIGFAEREATKDGLWLSSRNASVVTATRSTNYTIHRTPRPVFDTDVTTLADVLDERTTLFVIDRRVDALYGQSIRRYASEYLDVCDFVPVTATEKQKEWSQVERICQHAINKGLGRNGVIVSVGGGITLDVAGMAAAVYRRGVGYVRVPTTLMGLVDVGVGIKQGVNACGRKNLIGSFYAPLCSVNDYSFLRTLPLMEIGCGLAEIVKISLVRSAPLFEDLCGRSGALVAACRAHDAIASEMCYRAESLMLEELCVNLYERDLRRLVDFGHTFSPILEVSSRFRIPHGHAVALDMILSTAIAQVTGVAARDLLDQLGNLLKAIGLPLWDHELLRVDLLSEGLEHARSHRGGNLNLVVPSAPGVPTFLSRVAGAELEEAVALVRGLAEKKLGPAMTAGVA